MGGMITKGLIPCEFRLPGRYQHIPFLYVMDAVNGITPAFPEKGTEYLPVYRPARLLFHCLSQRLQLQRVMSPQSGIPP